MPDSSLNSIQRSSIIPANVYLKPPIDGGGSMSRQVRPTLVSLARAPEQTFLAKAKNLLSRALDVIAPGGLRADSKIRHAREEVSKALGDLTHVLKANRFGGLNGSEQLQECFKDFREACKPFTRLNDNLNRELVSQISARMSRLSVEEQSAVRESFLNSGDGNLQAVMMSITGSDFEWDLTCLRVTDPASQQRLMAAFTRLDAAANLLGQSPAAHDELTSHLIEIEQTRPALDRQVEELNRLKPVASEKAQRLTATLVSALRDLNGDLQTRQASLRAMHEANPTSLRDIYRFKAQTVDAGIRLIDQLQLQNKALPPNSKSVVLAARNALDARQGELVRASQEPQAAATPPASKLKELLRDREEERTATLLKEAFRSVGWEKAAGAVKHDLHRQHVEVLNEQGWNTIAKTITFTHEGRLQEYASTIQPGPQLLASYNGKGVCCHTTWEDRHAVNLARSELKDKNGKTLFAGFRHGVHSAYGIADATLRSEANVRRAKETLQAIIESDPQKLAAAKNGDTVTLRLASISLLTPDLQRSKLGLGGVSDKNERLMLQEQLAAWKAVSGDQTLDAIKTHNGQPIRVQVEIAPMNFGVNLGAIGPVQSVDRSGLLTGWTHVNGVNQAAVNAILGDDAQRRIDERTSVKPFGGWVGDFLKSGAAEDKKGIVRELATQIEDIWTSAAYRNGGADPYKMVARLAVLTHKLGATPVWNCKSGKDRTGELDVEAKFLTTQIQLAGKVPAPGRARAPEEKAQLMQMALNSGNHEMQRLNVGVMGFKLEGMQGVIGAQMGGADAAARHVGLSKTVKS